MYRFAASLLLLATVSGTAFALCPPSLLQHITPRTSCNRACPMVVSATRRSFVENVSIATIAGTVAFVTNTVPEAAASGGATAGGVYLLSVGATTSLGGGTMLTVER